MQEIIIKITEEEEQLHEQKDDIAKPQDSQEDQEVATMLQDLSQSIEHSPRQTSPPKQPLELLSDSQIQEIAEDMGPVHQEAQQIVLLSRLLRQDKCKGKIEDSTLLQHMIQEQLHHPTFHQSKNNLLP